MVSSTHGANFNKHSSRNKDVTFSYSSVFIIWMRSHHKPKYMAHCTRSGLQQGRSDTTQPYFPTEYCFKILLPMQLNAFFWKCLTVSHFSTRELDSGWSAASESWLSIKLQGGLFWCTYCAGAVRWQHCWICLQNPSSALILFGPFHVYKHNCFMFTCIIIIFSLREVFWDSSLRHTAGPRTISRNSLLQIHLLHRSLWEGGAEKLIKKKKRRKRRRHSENAFKPDAKS